MALAPLDLLAPIVADRTAHLRTFDGSGVKAGGAGGFLATGSFPDPAPQRVEDGLPGAVLLPGDEVIPRRALGEEVVGQILPLTARAGLIHQGVDDLP